MQREKARQSTRRANHFGFAEVIVNPRNQKYSAFAVGQISGLNTPVSPDKRGGSRSSRNARWDAMDADVPTTNGIEAYGEVVWS